MDELAARGALLINAALQRAEGSVAGMACVEELTDAEVAEMRASADAFAGVEAETAPLVRFLNVLHGVKWLDLGEDEQPAFNALLDGRFGEPALGPHEDAGGRVVRPSLDPAQLRPSAPQCVLGPAS